MAEASSDKSDFSHSVHRIEGLSDGIFAIAMTLLVLTLTLPDELAQTPSSGLLDLIVGQAHKFLNYFFAFLILAIFWIMHHQQFQWVRRVDIKLLLINVVMLMFVSLMPFSTDIAGDFSGMEVAEVFFASNVMVIDLLLLANWTYATREHRLVGPNVGQKVIAIENRRCAVILLISAFTIGLSFVIPPWNLLVYAVTPVVLFLR